VHVHQGNPGEFNLGSSKHLRSELTIPVAKPLNLTETDQRPKKLPIAVLLLKNGCGDLVGEVDGAPLLGQTVSKDTEFIDKQPERSLFAPF
jgi:hypothetical protein